MTDSEIKIEQRPGRVFKTEQKFHWPIIAPKDANLDTNALLQASQQAQDHNSDSLLIIQDNQLVFEQYWNEKTASDVQQTYSGTKSLFSLLIGRVIEGGYIKNLDQPVRDFVPEMSDTQSQLTFRNVMAMESGMAFSKQIASLEQTGMSQLEIALTAEVTHPPFETYRYNNAAYRLLFTALERAADMDLEELTETEIFEPLSFDGAYWMRLYAIEGDRETFTGYQSIRMTPCDFAKSAQVIVDEGKWNREPFVSADHVGTLIRSPAPEVNPSFGLFHFINAGSFFRGYFKPEIIDRQLVPGAPEDLFLMFGAGGQVVAGIPSQKLVVVRTGQHPGSIYEPDNYIAELLRTITDAIK